MSLKCLGNNKIQWKQAICGLLDLGFSEFSIKDCEQAKKHLDSIIDAIILLEQERKDMIEELETANIKTEILRSAVPDLSNKYDTERMKIMKDLEFAHNTAIYKKYFTIKDLHSTDSFSKQEVQRLMEERVDLQFNAKKLQEDWEFATQSVSDLIKRRVESNFNIQEAKKEQINVVKRTREVTDIEKTAEIKHEEVVKDRDQTKKVLDEDLESWKTKYEEQSRAAGSERRKMNELLDVLFSKTENINRLQRLHEVELVDLQDKKAKVEELHESVESISIANNQLDEKIKSKKRVNKDLINDYSKLLIQKEEKNLQLTRKISSNEKSNSSLADYVKQKQKTLKEKIFLLENAKLAERAKLKFYEGSLEKIVWVEGEVVGNNATTDKLNSKHEKEREERKYRQQHWEEEVVKAQKDLDWELETKLQTVEEIGEVKTELGECEEKLVTSALSLAKSIEVITLKREEAIEKRNRLQLETRQIETAAVELQVKIPDHARKLEMKKSEVNQAVKEIENDVQIVEQKVESLTDEVKEREPKMIELRENFCVEKVKKDQSMLAFQKSQSEFFNLKINWKKFRKNLLDAQTRVDSLKAQVEHANLQVTIADHYHFEQLKRSGQDLKKLLDAEKLVLQENSLFIGRINDEVRMIKGRMSFFLKMVRALNNLPKQITSLQHFLALLTGFAKKMQKDSSSDMEQSLQIIRDLEKSVLASISRVDRTVEGLKEKMSDFESYHEKNIADYMKGMHWGNYGSTFPIGFSKCSL